MATFSLYKKKQRTFFTHSDLHQTNIFVQAGQLSCIIDWEHAGFKLEFWEYIKALWSQPSSSESKAMMCEAFEEDCRDELAAEELLWWLKHVF